ncbi:MAG: DUF6798 domain-containing protein [Cyanobacteria bacterium P01_D01_bin.156]
MNQENIEQVGRLPRSMAVPTYIIVVAVALIAVGYKFPTSNTLIEMPPIVALLKAGAYSNDYYVQDALQMTPRYYYQYLMFAFAKIIKSLPTVYFGAYIAAFASYLIGLYSIGLFFGKNRLTAVGLCFLGFTAVDGTVGYVSLFRSEPIPAIFAMGLVIWGVYFCLARRWIWGYSLFGVACMIQFLVGLLPAGLMVPLLFLDAWRHKKMIMVLPPLSILIGFAGLVYVPMVLMGKTGTGLISNEEFIYLYGYIRHPHHILPTHWPGRTWRNFVCFISAGFLYLLRVKRIGREDKVRLGLVVIGSLIGLLWGYLFVEVYPLATFAKLQLARTTPFAQLMILIVVAILASEYWKKGDKSLAVALLIIPGLHNGGMLMLVMAIAINLVDNRYSELLQKVTRFSSRAMLGISILLLAAYPQPIDAEEIWLNLLMPLMLMSALLLPTWVEANYAKWLRKWGSKSTRLFLAGAFGLVGILGLAVFEQLPAPFSKIVNERITIYKHKTDSLTRLASRFQTISSADALVLTPPSMTTFRFYSQRSVVFNLYSSPFTDAGYEEWSRRLTRVLGSFKLPLNRHNMDKLFAERTASELVRAAREFNADYILTRPEWHPDLQGTLVDSEAGWAIYKIDQRNRLAVSHP